MRLAYVGKLLFVRSMSVDVRDSMSETECQRLNVRVGFTDLVTRLGNTSHLSVQFDVGV